MIFKPLLRYSDSKAENRILHLHNFGFPILPRFFEGQKMVITRGKYIIQQCSGITRGSGELYAHRFQELIYLHLYFLFKYDLGQKYQAPQVRPDRGSNS